jgi:hypothetical protein
VRFFRVVWVAWALWALSLATAFVSAVFRSLNLGSPRTVSQWPLVFDVGFLLVWLSFATVGALVASRQPKNAIGWIFCALGVCNSLAVASQGYAIYALLTGPAYLPGGAVANWLSSLLAGPSSSRCSPSFSCSSPTEGHSGAAGGPSYGSTLPPSR